LTRFYDSYYIRDVIPIVAHDQHACERHLASSPPAWKLDLITTKPHESTWYYWNTVKISLLLSTQNDLHVFGIQIY
jgi:hypothetical protein